MKKVIDSNINSYVELPFGSLCKERKESSKNPILDGFSRYIGLEHIEKDKIEINRWGSIEEDSPSFTKVFREGDVLLSKRRPYLRKASVVQFDGVCSSDIIVLRANKHNVVPEVFPHLIHTAKFWNFAVKTSSGSLSPRTKFSLLKDFVLRVPVKEKQSELLSILKKTMEIDSQTQLLLESIDVLIKAYKSFEMPLASKTARVRLSDFLKESFIEGSNGKVAKKLTVKLYGKGITSKGDISGSENTKYFKRSAGQFIYSKLDFLNGAFAVVPDELDGYESTSDLPAFDVEEGLCTKWLFHYVNRPDFYEYFSHRAKGGRKAKRISPKDFLNITIPGFNAEFQAKQVEILESMEMQKSLLLDKLGYMRRVREKMIFGG